MSESRGIIGARKCDQRLLTKTRGKVILVSGLTSDGSAMPNLDP